MLSFIVDQSGMRDILGSTPLHNASASFSPLPAERSGVTVGVTLILLPGRGGRRVVFVLMSIYLAHVLS